MTIPNINLDLNAEDIGVGLTLKTKDGKTISLDAYSVKEPELARVRLDDLKIGDKLKQRCGRVLKIESLLYERKDGYACRAVDGLLSLYYLKDGRSNLTLKEDDIVEIIRDEPARVSLKDAAIDDKFEVRDGRIFTVTKFAHMDNALLGESEEGDFLWFNRNGFCLLGRKDLEAISLTKSQKSRVSIGDAKKGDIFVLRSGEKWIHTGETNSLAHRAYRDEKGELWFLFDGSCPACPRSYDVVEIIPAPKPTLSDRISAQLNQIDAKIDRIVVCYDDWKELSGKSDDDNAKTYFKGVTLRYGFSSKKGEFSLVFAAD